MVLFHIISDYFIDRMGTFKVTTSLIRNKTRSNQVTGSGSWMMMDESDITVVTSSRQLAETRTLDQYGY